MSFLAPKYGSFFYKKMCLKKTKNAPSTDFCIQVLKRVQKRDIRFVLPKSGTVKLVTLFSGKKCQFLTKKLQKSVTNFTVPDFGKINLISFFYTLFRTYMQKSADGAFFFFRTLKIEIFGSQSTDRSSKTVSLSKIYKVQSNYFYLRLLNC